MAATFDDLLILKSAERIADEIWKYVIQWDSFTRDVVGKQLATAADSIGANIAESYGRFSFGEKLQFLYYARGSLFETKYWLNRTRERGLLPSQDAQAFANKLTDLARQLNTFRNGLKSVKYETQVRSKSLRESISEDPQTFAVDSSLPIFSDTDLDWLIL